MNGPAPLLPDGFPASAWFELEPNARALFLEGFLAINPKLELTGTVDYESAREPILLDTELGSFVSLRGDAVDTGQGLIVNITEGTVAGQPVLFWAAVMGIVLILTWR